MQKFARRLEEVQRSKELRLETPVYYGFASWKTPSGRRKQALFMEKIIEPSLSDLGFEEAKVLYQVRKLVPEKL